MHAEELTPLEQQLAACQPSADGLDADAMLFAAGRAAAQPRRPVVLPALACGFAVLSLVLACGLVSERSERIALAGQLRHSAVVVDTPAPTIGPSPLPTVSSDSYLATRRMVEQGIDAWPTQDAGPAESSPINPPSPMLHAWDTVLEQ